MLFNYDSYEIVGALGFFIIVHGIFAYTMIHNSSNVGTALTPITNESLVNTTPTLESISQLRTTQLNNFTVEPTNLTDVADYVDVGVQTESKSLWTTFKDWLRDVFSVNSSDVGSFGHDGVENWRGKLKSDQSVDLHDSESPLDGTSPIFNSTLDKEVEPFDSASQVSEVISESGLQVPSNSVYDINVYNQEFLYESLGNVSNHINYNYVINGINHTVLVIGNNILTLTPIRYI